jgi:ribonucleoside-diphosphate reductase alpha chain
LAQKFFDYMWKGWLGPASPVMSNTGTERGLNISCYSLHLDDSIDGIFNKVHELACLSKGGGGVGFYVGDIRPSNSPIRGGENGHSDGVVPWLKVFDSATVSTSQGSTRRGASAAYLPIEHPDIEEFLRIRRPQGDANRQCLNLHHAVSIGDEFMKSLVEGNEHNRKIWQEVLKTRVETGEPYLFFRDNTNNQNPQCYKDLGLDVSTSNICTEITGYTDPDHTFVCCLSSLNLSLWDEWKNTDLVYYSTWFLDGILQEFIDRAKGMPGMEPAIRFAEKGRMLGLGVMGFHSLLQDKLIPFDSLQAKMMNRLIFKTIRKEADRATKDLADEYGEPEWCKGYNRRNTHTMALAPTVTNSKLVGHVSASIEPSDMEIYIFCRW